MLWQGQYRPAGHEYAALLLSPFVVPSLSGLRVLPGPVLIGGVRRLRGSRAAVIAGGPGYVAASATVAVLLERDDPRDGCLC